MGFEFRVHDWGRTCVEETVGEGLVVRRFGGLRAIRPRSMATVAVCLQLICFVLHVIVKGRRTVHAYSEVLKLLKLQGPRKTLFWVWDLEHV